MWTKTKIVFHDAYVEDQHLFPEKGTEVFTYINFNHSFEWLGYKFEFLDGGWFAFKEGGQCLVTVVPLELHYPFQMMDSSGVIETANNHIDYSALLSMGYKVKLRYFRRKGEIICVDESTQMIKSVVPVATDWEPITSLIKKGLPIYNDQGEMSDEILKYIEIDVEVEDPSTLKKKQTI